ncbi:MAG: glucosaminidase domain-containing protein [Alphaproteobacteria bacterium]|nr:glucosaminidase domain-containing protein [Alphaproteobacteria bacterium]
MSDPIDDDAATGEQIARAELDPDSKFAKFFAANYPHAARIGAKYAVDPTLLLGVAALESGYGQNRDAREQNNPLGMRPDGKTPITFPSTEAAWKEWGREFGPRVLGVGKDVGTFLDRLQEDHRTLYGPTRGGDYNGPYISVDPDWKKKVAGTITGVRQRLPIWQNYSDNAP